MIIVILWTGRFCRGRQCWLWLRRGPASAPKLRQNRFKYSSTAVAILVGVLGHRATLGFKTFLLIECGMAVLSPLLNVVISDGNHTHHHRRK